MKRWSQRTAWMAGLLITGLLTGCVERRFVITTNVPGAIVYDEKGQPMGATPVDREFTYYGKYRFTVVKDGFQTQVIEENVRAPWYEWVGLDFVSENLLPFNIADVRRFHYTLQPAQMVPAEAILQDGTVLRGRGQAIQPATPPAAPVPLPPLPAAPPMMPPP